MATHRYWDIRRDIYELCSDTSLRRNRTFREMKRLFKWSYWTILISMIICMTGAFVLIFTFSTLAYYSLIPIGLIVLLSIISEFLSDRMYNPSERKKELDERSSYLNQFVHRINEVLLSHGISTKEQRAFLHKECEEQLAQHSKPFNSVSHRAFDMLIGVPIGALISATMYKSENSDIMANNTLLLIVVGLAIIGIFHSIRKVTYYSEGHFKDRCLLDALNELYYYTQEDLIEK